MAAKLKKVADGLGRGANHLPGPGGGGKIPSGTAPASPKPTAAVNSGKKGAFPSAASTNALPLRSNGKKGSAPAVGSALKPSTKLNALPLRSAKAAK